MRSHPSRPLLLCLAFLVLTTTDVLGALSLDPAGDTFGAAAVKPDIVSVDANTSATAVEFTVTYAGAIAAPSAFAANSIVGFIDLDTDQNAATGGTAAFGGPVAGGASLINFAIATLPVPGPTVGLGDEFLVQIGPELFHPGQVEVLNTTTLAVTLVSISFAATSFTVSIPLANLGGDDGALNFGVITGSGFEPTDRIPNGATPLATIAAVPAPGTLALLSLGISGLLIATARRRK